MYFGVKYERLCYENIDLVDFWILRFNVVIVLGMVFYRYGIENVINESI